MASSVQQKIQVKISKAFGIFCAKMGNILVQFWKKTVKEANVSILMCNSNFRLGNKNTRVSNSCRIFSC